MSERAASRTAMGFLTPEMSVEYFTGATALSSFRHTTIAMAIV